MASARGDALDWALALARAPGERHGLRQRPLPEGMETLLHVACGSQADALAEAAAHAGRPAAEVVDAARFYLREMLFFPEADAYRVLGLTADASNDQIKHHHRLLQQWLHPDRPTSDWDATFAARVNAAWSQLRTPARREKYAAHGAGMSALVERAPGWTAPAVRHASGPVRGMPSPAFSKDEARWRRRAPVLALFGVCAVLGVLAVHDMQRAPEGRLGERAMAGVSSREVTSVVDLHLPAALAAAGHSAPSTPAAPEPSSKPRSKQGSVTVVPVLPTARPMAAAGELTTTPVAVANTAPISPPASVPAVRKRMPGAVESGQLATAPAPAPALDSPGNPAAVVANPVQVTRPPAPVVAVAKPVPVVPHVPEPAPPLAAVTAAAAVASRPPVLPASAPAANSREQVAQIQRTGKQLLAFVVGSGSGMPPIWANYAAQTQASRARAALQGNGRIAVGVPDWRVGGSSAAMQASLTPRNGDARRLRVDLVWRDQRWLVTGLALEQAL